MAKALDAALGAGAKQVHHLHTQEFGIGKAAEPLGHGIDIEHGLGGRVEEEKRIAALLEERDGQFIAVIMGHGKFRRSTLREV